MPAAAMIARAVVLRLRIVLTASAPDVLIGAAVCFAKAKSDGAFLRNLPLANHDCQTCPPGVSACGRGSRRAAGACARCKRAGLPGAAGASARRLCRRRPLGHQRAADRSMAVGT